MGTNYYIRKKSDAKYKLHVGKISCGWRFLMAGHLKDYNPVTNVTLTITKFQDYVNLLKKYKGDAYLVNEYEDTVDINELIHMINEHTNDRAHVIAGAYITIAHKNYDVIFNCDFC